MPRLTQRLYYDDAYTLQFEAEVVEHTDHRSHSALVLDRTYFYPEGGGQQPDHGLLNGVRVVDVQTRESDRAVLHILERPLADRRVEAQIDAARRFDHMQHHCGQHILSQALARVAQAATVSVHMSADSMTIDVNRPALTPDEWAAVEALANQVVQENRVVRCWFPDPDELATLPIRKLPDVTGKVRVVDVGGFDITACGGTHVARTGEIGLIKVVRVERRGETTRLEFRCGARALADYGSKNDVIQRLSSDLTVGYWDLPESIQRLQAENKALRTDLKALREQLAEAEAGALLAGARGVEMPGRGAWRVVIHAVEGRDANEVKLLVQRLVTPPGTVALVGMAGEKAQLIFARAEDVALDVVPLLKAALARLHCERGGGRPNLAQGGGVPATLEAVRATLAAAAGEITPPDA
jgi:alanyl-tRNA synthetase